MSKIGPRPNPPRIGVVTPAPAAPLITRAEPAPARTPESAEVGLAARKLAQESRHVAPTFQAKAPSSMVAMRIAGSAAKAATAEAQQAFLSVKLVDPTTGKPPTVDQVADSMLSLLRKQIPSAAPDLKEFASQARESYYVLTYDETKGIVSLTQVAAGTEDAVTVTAEDVASAVRPGEVLLGGLHNHPGKQRARSSKEDSAASAQLADRFAGYVDYVIAGAGPNVSASAVRPAQAIGDPESVTFRAWNPFQMNKDDDKPSSVERVDKAHVDVPGAQNHVHLDKGRGSQDEDGGWGHGGGRDSDLSNKEKKWIDKWDKK